jgi:hypothetical protein
MLGFFLNDRRVPRQTHNPRRAKEVTVVGVHVKYVFRGATLSNALLHSTWGGVVLWRSKML